MSELKIWCHAELTRIRAETDRLVENLCCDLGLEAPSVARRGEVRVSEGEDSVTVTAELPGLAAEDVSVTALEPTVLVISGAGQTFPGGFSKQIRLPCRIRPEEARAAFENGVLTVRLPKCRERPGGTRIPIAND